uniref:AlkB homolog 1, histone H2A dioxygenase n=1 Tax=Mus musculus TaxID=10090 RepID=E0CZH7_MOUSE
MGKMAAAVASLATLAAEPREDAFRKLFRFYRQSRPGTADLGAVIDFSEAHLARSPKPGVPQDLFSFQTPSSRDARGTG